MGNDLPATDGGGGFAGRVRSLILSVPFGRVATYGQIALLAGRPGGARGVAWILHSSSRKYGLPWHRIVSGRGTISLPRGSGFEKQRDLLMRERVETDEAGRVDLDRYIWKPAERGRHQERG